MQIKIFEVGPFQQNTYLIYGVNRKAVIIDAGFSSDLEFATFTSYLHQHKLSVEAILLTHAHVDHILGLDRLLTFVDVPVYLHQEDRFLWENFEHQAKMFGFNSITPTCKLHDLKDKNTLEVAGFTIDTLYTPGHSPDHCSFYIKNEGMLLSGDALFRESIGRTDLYKGDFDTLKISVIEKLFTLPRETKVYPGHGPSTSIGHEIEHNPFI
jgi:hydroxyacylglutathione hydrolase